MKVYFRVDASIHIGNGHVMRCIALAEELTRRGSDVVFVMRPQPGDLCCYTESRGFKVERLPELCEWIIPNSTADYATWLQVPVLKDAKDFLSVVTDADLVVIDHYGITVCWEELIKSRISCKLVAIDDLVREHQCDLIIDQTMGRKASEYLSISKGAHVLAGTKYALLNARFSELHPVALEAETNKRDHRLLLTMGGIDNPNATLKVLKALSRRESTIQTTVLLSAKAPHFDSVASFCAQHRDWIKHIHFSEDMAALMFEHTISAGAPGSTSWERASMGLPGIMIPLAENQQEICQNLVKEEAAMALPLEAIPELLNTMLDELLKNYETLRKNNLNLCDGKGCERVMEKMRMLEWY